MGAKPKNKNAGRGPGGKILLSVPEVRKLLESLYQTGTLTRAERFKLLNVAPREPSAPPLPTNKDPNNLADLLPGPERYRHNGIWRRNIDAIVASDEDLAGDSRDVVQAPCGLSNLGNTCYVNAALQVLFTCSLFRKAIYSVDASIIARDPLLEQLQLLFLQMEFGLSTKANPTGFADVLKLQYGEQQDAQEFQKLLMQCVEDRLAASSSAEVRDVIKKLYRGRSSYVTTCRRCGLESERSRQLTDFFELDLQVKGMKTLQASLQALVGKEAMEGENQYMCEMCGCKVDADREFCLRQLPPCLRISLQRFVFCLKSGSKQKCNEIISFPMTLNLSGVVRTVDGTPPAESGEYDLTAIILHRGTSASAGHYVAIVKDQKQGKWWKYDDETVQDMGVHPFKGVKWDPAAGPDEGPKKPGRKRKVPEPPPEPEAAAAEAQPRRRAPAARPAEASPDAAAPGDGASRRPRRGTPSRVGDPPPPGPAPPSASECIVINDGSPPHSASPGGAVQPALAPDPPKSGIRPPGGSALPSFHAGARDSRSETLSPFPPRGAAPAAPATASGAAAEPPQQTRAEEPKPAPPPGAQPAAAPAPGASSEPAAGAAAASSVARGMAATLQGGLPSAVPPPAQPPAASATAPQHPPASGDAARRGGAHAAPAEAAPAAAAASAAGPSAAAAPNGALPEELSSKDAYMLMYTRRGCDFGMCVASPTSASELPAKLREDVEKMHATYQGRAREQAERKEKLTRDIRQRRELLQQVAAALPRGPDDDCRFVDTEWLTQWSNSERDAVRIDNEELLCPHRRLDPLAWRNSRVVSALGWQMLQSMSDGGPELSPDDLCLQCCRTALESIVARENTDEYRKEILEQVKALLDPATTSKTVTRASSADGAAGKLLISRKWLQAWKIKGCRINAFPESSPTACITCPHRALLPELHKDGKSARTSSRIAVPRHVFDFIKDNWLQHAAKQADQRALPHAPATAPRATPAKNGAAEAPPSSSQRAGGDCKVDADDDDDCIALDDKPPVDAAAAKPAVADAPPGGDAACNGLDGPITIDVDEPSGAPAAAAEAPEIVNDENCVPMEVDGAGAAPEAKPEPLQPLLEEFVVTRNDARALECRICKQELSASAKQDERLKERMLREKEELADLAAAAPLFLQLGGTYALVPAGWLRGWRRWVNSSPWRANTTLSVANAAAAGAATKGAAKAASLDPLPEAFADYVAHVDGQLRMLQPPPTASSRRGKWSQTDTSSDLWTVVTQEEWAALKRWHGDASVPDLRVTLEPLDAAEGGSAQAQAPDAAPGPLGRPSLGLPAFLGVSTRSTSRDGGDAAPQTPGGVSSGPPEYGTNGTRAVAAELDRIKRQAAGLPDDPGSAGLSGDDDDESFGPSSYHRTASAAGPLAVFTPEVPVCWDTVEQRRAKSRQSLLVYTNADLVCQVTSLEAALLPNSAATNTTRRNRRGRAAIKVSHDTTLRQLKLSMYQPLDLHPINMDVYVRGKLLEENDATLQALDVASDDIVNVVNNERTDANDYASIAEWTQLAESSGATLPTLPPQGGSIERGFVDTLLVGTGHS